MRHLRQWLILSLLALAAFSSVGCDKMASCVASNVFEPELLGPFVNVPSARDVDRDADTITTTSPRVYFLWINPEMERGDRYRCEILTVDVAGLDEGVLMGSAEGVAESGVFRGPVVFDAPPAGWLAGTYSARMLRNDTPFDTVRFTVLP